MAGHPELARQALAPLEEPSAQIRLCLAAAELACGDYPVAIDTYKRNGFEVVPLDMAAISKLEGAIRCSTYAVERELG